MTWLTRPREPISLRDIRNQELPKLRALKREPLSTEISGYDVTKEQLWRIQYFKCCYCEQKIVPDYNDVEHYRPKALALRLPGCVHTHGYWWLAFTWNNLLFSCAGCNRSAKRALFPLDDGSKSVTAENRIFRTEKPLLIDPYKTNPVEHIEYHNIIGYWQPRARNGSKLGAYTITTCKLDRPALKERRTDYFKRHLIQPIKLLQGALGSGDAVLSKTYYQNILQFFSKESEFSGMAYDAIRQNIDSIALHKLTGHTWPNPNDVYLP